MINFSYIVKQVKEIGALTNDSEDMREKKQLFALIEVFGDILISCIQSIIYFMIGKNWAAIFSIFWVFFLVINLTIYSYIRSNFYNSVYRVLFMGAIGPFIMTILLGGLINSGMFILVSLAAPLGALLFLGPHHIWLWMTIQYSLLAVAGFIEPYIHHKINTPIDQIIGNLLFNLYFTWTLNIIVFYYFIRQRNLALELWRNEEAKSQNLLLNILPKDIVTTLRDEQHIIAESFEMASVLFADIVSFTPISADLNPEELVKLLNEVFCAFDNLVDYYQLEKIKTIGDCYMVASGVPKPRVDHAHALAHLALDMQAYVANHTFYGEHKLSFRMGINSGAVVAGVIGHKKFSYDLWGDAVNTASRMESHGKSGTIQITQSTYEIIKDQFECTSQGIIQIKGKGDMNVWLLLACKK